MRIALVHDGIFCKGGAERVLLTLHKAFPDAPIFTSIYDKENSYSEFNNCNIRTTWLQKIVPNERRFKNSFFLLGLRAMQSHKFSNFDVILSSTTHCAKYINSGRSNLVINYCYTPFRFAWNPISYDIYVKATGLKKIILDNAIIRLKKIDYRYAQYANKYIAMTDEMAGVIRNHYGIKNNIEIIKPSIDTRKYHISKKIGDYYLVVSRLEKYKKIDLVINTFNKLGSKLIIVGRGMEEKELKKSANSNIEFLDGVSQSCLNNLYSRCKALIFPQREDYGLTPLEANASGRPIIAYGRGGVRSTMIPFKLDKPNSDFTAIFFNKQECNSLINAINLFETLNINSQFIYKHAQKFDDKVFISRLRNYVTCEFNKWKNNNY